MDFMEGRRRGFSLGQSQQALWTEPFGEEKAMSED